MIQMVYAFSCLLLSVEWLDDNQLRQIFHYSYQKYSSDNCLHRSYVWSALFFGLPCPPMIKLPFLHTLTPMNCHKSKFGTHPIVTLLTIGLKSKKLMPRKTVKLDGQISTCQDGLMALSVKTCWILFFSLIFPFQVHIFPFFFLLFDNLVHPRPNRGGICQI